MPYKQSGKTDDRKTSLLRERSERAVRERMKVEAVRSVLNHEGEIGAPKKYTLTFS